MSFKDLIKDESFKETTKELTIDHGDQKLVFTAHRLGYLDSLDVAVAQAQGRNAFALQVAKSISDSDGKHMTYEQALALPDDLAAKFWEASAEVNKREAQSDEPKN